MADATNKEALPSANAIKEEPSTTINGIALEKTPERDAPAQEPAVADEDNDKPVSRPQSPSHSIANATNGVLNPDDSEAETLVLSGSQQNTPAKTKPSEIHGSGVGPQDDSPKGKKGGRKRKKGAKSSLYSNDEDSSDSSWASDASRDQNPKKPRLSPKDENKSEDEFHPAQSRPNGSEQMNRLRKRKAQHDLPDLATNSSSNQKEHGAQSPSPRTRQRRSTPQESVPRNPSPQRRPHRRTASIQSSSAPTIETRRSRRTNHHSRDASSPSSAEQSPAYIPPPHSGNTMARKVRDHFGDTPLARACTKGDLDAAKKAFETNPLSLNEANNALNTPLHHSSLRGHEAVVEFLLEQGCAIDVVNEDGDSPLHDAVGNSHIEVVRHLLKAGLDPRQANKIGETPKDLVEAMEEGEDKQKLDQLLTQAIKTAPDRERGSGTPQLTSQFSGNSRATPGGTNLRLVEYTVKALQDYAAYGNGEGVNELLRAGVVPDHNCIVAAAAAGQDFILSILLSLIDNKDPDPKTYKDNTPLLKAIGKGHLNVLNTLISHIDPTRRTFYGNKSYPQVAKDARGPNWQEEVKLLEHAIESFKTSPPVTASPRQPMRHRAEARSEARRRAESGSSSPEPRKPRRKLVTGKHLKSQSAPNSAGLSTDKDDSQLITTIANVGSTNASDGRPSHRESRLSSSKENDRSPEARSARRSSSSPENTKIKANATREANHVDATAKKRKEKSTTQHQDEHKGHAPKTEVESRRAKDGEGKHPRLESEKKRKEEEKENEDDARRKIEAEKEKEIQRKKDEIKRKEEAQQQKENAEKAAKEEAARKAEELRKEQEEEARKKAEAERALQEELRRKEEEEAERQRVAREQAERAAYLKPLPRGLRLPLSLGKAYPVNKKGLQAVQMCLEDWNTVQVVQRYEIDPDCPPDQRTQWMMLNFHAAILLGEERIDFKDRPSWDRAACTEAHKLQLFFRYRQIINFDCHIQHLTQEEQKQAGIHGPDFIHYLRGEEAKWAALGPDQVFWIKFDDMISETTPDKAPRLADFRIIQSALCHVRRLEVPFASSTFGATRWFWEPVAQRALEKLKRGEELTSSNLDDFLREAKSEMPPRMIYANGRSVEPSPKPN